MAIRSSARSPTPTSPPSTASAPRSTSTFSVGGWPGRSRPSPCLTRRARACARSPDPRVASTPQRDRIGRLVTWGFLWLMLALKLPIAALIYLVWWAIKQEPEDETSSDDD